MSTSQASVSENQLAAGVSDKALIAADRVSGTTVYNQSGEKLGKIEDVAIEKVDGEVAYAILSFGGFLGLGSRYYPVPWRMLSYSTEMGGYVIACDKEHLENAPSFDRDDLSGWSDGTERDAIFSYYGPYGVRPYWM